MTPEAAAEIAMCNECISHLLENVGPDHIIVKYRAALIKSQEQVEEIKQANHRYADLQNICDDQYKEIKRLEDALVEERARRNHPWSFPERITSSSIDPTIIVRAQDEAKEEARAHRASRRGSDQMTDILDRAEDLAERYNSSGFIHKEATLLLPELIAEIKRLRWQRQDLAMATPCSTDDQLSQRKYDFSEAVAQNAMTPHRPTPKQINYTDGLKRMIARDEQQAAYVARLEAAYQEAEAACRYYEGGLMDCEADDKAAFFGWPGRDYQAMSDQSILDLYRKEAREALERIKRGEQE